MSLAKDKIILATKHLQESLKHLDQGNKRLAVGEADHAKDLIFGIIYTLIADIEIEEGKF